MLLSYVPVGSTVFLPGMPVSAVVNGISGTAVSVTVNGKCTTWASTADVVLKMTYKPKVEPVPVTPKTIVKKWKPMKDRPSARRFFIDTFTKSPTISFNEMWDRLTYYYPDMKCGSCPTAARQMFNMYRYQVRMGNMK